MKLSYKKLHQDHLFITYRWINLKSVRQNSIGKKKINLKNHKKWFSDSINSKVNFIRIIYKAKNPVGIVRLEKKKDIYLISYLITPKFRRKGYAFKALNDLINIFRKKNKKKIHAYVNKKNLASIKIFFKLKFKSIIHKKSKNLLKFEYKL